MDDYSGYGYEDNTYPDTVYINDVLCYVERADEGLYISICSDADCDSVTEMYINAWTRVISKAAYDIAMIFLFLRWEVMVAGRMIMMNL